ncbi:MAG: hypothetical protein HZC02_04995 [Candidatus Levybacteria bacterium]|nr:hypothetical protein [Candidatus Levybacteria bacterium]
MDEFVTYLKSHLERAEFYAQQWDELLASYPQLTTISTQQAWDQFRKEHEGLELDEMLWKYGPASTLEEIQSLLSAKEPETPKEKEKEKKESLITPPPMGKRLSGTLLITDGQGQPIMLPNATITIVDSKTKREIAKIQSNIRGYFQSPPLPLSRYVLTISHPNFPEGRRRVINLRATQPPLALVFRPLLPTRQKPPTPSANAAPITSEASSDQKQARPATEIIGSQGQNNTSTEKMVPYFEDSPTSTKVDLNAFTTPVENFAPVIPLAEEIKYDKTYQDARDEQIKRWRSDSGFDISSPSGQDYLFGNPKNPSAPTLDGDLHATLTALHPGLVRQYQAMEAQKVYHRHDGKPNPLADPIFQQVERAAEKARVEALRAARNNPHANLHRISLEAGMPYYRLFLEQFPQKAAAYQGVDAGLKTVSSLFKKFTNASQDKTQPSNEHIFTPKPSPSFHLPTYGEEIEAYDDDSQNDENETEDDSDEYENDDDNDNERNQGEYQQNSNDDNQDERRSGGSFNPLQARSTALRLASGISRTVSGISTAISAATSAVSTVGGAIAGGGWVIIVILLILLLIFGVFLVLFSGGSDKETSVNLSKKSTKEAVANGENIAYDLVVSYTGNAKVVRVTDKIPDNTEYVSADGPGAIFDPKTRTVTWTISGSTPSTSIPTAVCDMANPAEDPWPNVNRWNAEILDAINLEIRAEAAQLQEEGLTVTGINHSMTSTQPKAISTVAYNI